jgi:hypothetical protein
MHPGSRVLWRCTAPLAIVPRSYQLCQNGGLSVLSSVGEREKLRWVGDDSHVDFGLNVTLTTWHPLSAKVGTNFANKRRSLGRYSSLADWGHGVCFLVCIAWWKRKCETVLCLNAIVSSYVAKVRDEVFTHFHAVAIKRHSSMRNCLLCQDKFVVRNPLHVKENDYALDFALHLYRLFRSALNRSCHSNSRVRLMLSSPNSCLIIARVSIALFPRFDACSLLLCRIHRKISSGQDTIPDRET